MTNTALLAILIIVLGLVSYLWGRISATMTTLICMFAMVFIGAVPIGTALAGFGNTTTLMLVGMLIISDAFMKCGLSKTVGKIILTHFGKLKENHFIAVIFLISALFSGLFNGMIVIALIMPIIDAISVASDGKITRKGAYLAAGLGSACGGSLSVIGSSSMTAAVGLLRDATGYNTGFLEPAIIGLPGVLTGLIFYLTIGHALQNRVFDFEEIKLESVENFDIDGSDEKGRKDRITVACVLVIIAAVFMSNKFNIAMVSIIGAMILILAGVVDEKSAYRGVSWSTIIIVGASIGFAKGVELSGAAQIIADKAIDLFGGASDSAYIMCVIVMTLSSLLSNFMSNTAAVVITAPIGLTIAASIGADPVPFAICTAVGANLAMATPICTACITATLIAGYRPKDLLKIGGIVNLAGLIVTGICMKFIYF